MSCRLLRPGAGRWAWCKAWESSFRRGWQADADQVLLTHDDLSDRKRYLNARSTLRTLVDLGVVPVINENDTGGYRRDPFR